MYQHTTRMRPALRGLSATIALSATMMFAGACVGADDAPSASAPAAATEAAAATNPIVVITTNKGAIEVELNQEKAPISVANFLAYANSGHYSGTIFHRVIKDFMIQGGGFAADKTQKTTQPPIKNEADNGLKNARGTLAMARTGVVDSATSQFFINHKDNTFLDHTDKTSRGYGYTVFGKVVGGMDVVDAIATAPTSNAGGAFSTLPVDEVIIESVKLKE